MGVLLLGVGPGLAAPASAALCTTAEISPDRLSVGVVDVTRTWQPHVTGCTVESWTFKSTDLPWIRASDTHPTLTIDPDWLRNGTEGASTGSLTIVDPEGDVSSFLVKFGLRRGTRWAAAVNAGPEPIRKGKVIKVSAALGRANWDTGRYNGYARQRVYLQFRAAGTTTYRNVRAATTSAYGRVSAAAVARQDGTWRFFFAGHSTAGPSVSNGDYVDVR